MARNARGSPQDPLPPIDATPKGYTIDVRVFLAMITTAMALAFTAGVMVGPTNPSLANPILSLLGMTLPPAFDVRDNASNIAGGRSNIDAAPARKTAEGSVASTSIVGDANSSSKKAKEIIVNADGTIVEGETVIKQPKREKTDHVATLGYKIKETHVNIDTPVLEGQGENLPYERDITYNNATKENVKGEGEQPLLRDQTNPTGQHLLVDIKNLEAAFLNYES